MRHLSQSLPLSLLMLTVACGPKAPPAPAPAPVVVAPQPPPPPLMPEPEPEPERNADFRIQIDRADGTSESGRVVRVERGVDFYAANGFTDREIKTTVSLSRDGTSRDVRWDELKRVDIAYDTNSRNISCTYDSSVTPWAYICTLPATSTAVTADGATLDVTTRNVWRLTMDDDREIELYLSKLPVRQTDSSSAGMRNSENAEMYGILRTAVQQAATTAPTRIIINP